MAQIIIRHPEVLRRRADRDLKAQALTDDMAELDNKIDVLPADIDAEIALIDAALTALSNDAWVLIATQSDRINALRDALRAGLRGVKFALQTFRLMRRIGRILQRVARFTLAR